MEVSVYFLLAKAEDEKKVQQLEMPGGFKAVPIVWSTFGPKKETEKTKETKESIADARLPCSPTKENGMDTAVRCNSKKKGTLELPPPDKSTALHRMFRKGPPAAIISIGASQFDFPEMVRMPFEYRKRWLHYESPELVKPFSIRGCFAASQLPALISQNEHETRNPMICAISSAYHSKNRILRPYYSLRSQTYTNWSWIIIDDSLDDETWHNLQQLAETDVRIHVLRYSEHSGYIGKMKAAASALALTVGAKWIFELDHDDIIVPKCFEYLVEASLKHPHIGFIHSDFIELFEKNEEPFHYNGVFGFGYGAYINKRVNNKWHHVYQSHFVNDPTNMLWIVGVANHFRCWRSDVYFKMGGYSAHLPVADDYELLLRTFFETPCLRIAEMCYLQYRNDSGPTGDESGGNFTFRRNQLIQDMTGIIAEKYRPQIDARSVEIWGKTTDYNGRIMENWKYDKRRFKNADIVWFPDIENTISIVMPTYNRADLLKNAIASVLAQDYPKWRLYVIGDKCPVLNSVMNEYTDPRIYWWNLSEQGGPGGHLPRNYAMASVVVTPWVAFLDDDNTWDTNHLSSMLKRRDECPGVKCVVSSMKINGRPLYFDEPKLARVDTSCLLVDREVILSTGLMPSRAVGYAHDYVWVSQWFDQPFASTLMPTVNYNIATNAQNYEQLYAWYPDQPELARIAQNLAINRPVSVEWNTNPRSRKLIAERQKQQVPSLSNAPNTPSRPSMPNNDEKSSAPHKQQKPSAQQEEPNNDGKLLSVPNNNTSKPRTSLLSSLFGLFYSNSFFK